VSSPKDQAVHRREFLSAATGAVGAFALFSREASAAPAPPSSAAQPRLSSAPKAELGGAVNQSNVKHYRQARSVTEYKELPGRSHYIVGQGGWEEVADYALDWAMKHAAV
jgi:hypothetical protein